MKTHVNIPIFVPHLGCPNACVFCNQRRISGVSEPQTKNVERLIEHALLTVTPGTDVQIAFFGGSFTAIRRELMLSLLDTAYKYVSDGRVSGIRISTRPDCIDGEICRLLRERGVKSVELGIQSMDDAVLSASGRGHTAADTEKACAALLDGGFELVGQMMLGLPCSSPENELLTARRIYEMGCIGARIYPTVVFEDTELCDMAKRGEYAPLTTENAVARTCAVLEYFIDKKVKVIRIGLQSSEALVSGTGIYGGGYHEAIGEICLSRIYFKKMCEAIEKEKIENCGADIYVSQGNISRGVGYKKENITALKRLYNLKDIKLKEDLSMDEFSVRAERRRANVSEIN